MIIMSYLNWQDVDEQCQKPMACHQRASGHTGSFLLLALPKRLSFRHSVPQMRKSLRDQDHEHILIHISALHGDIVGIGWQNVIDQCDKCPERLLFVHKQQQHASNVV